MSRLDYAFQITKKIMFEVRNDEYFATSADKFNTRNTDFEQCGQCQDELLPQGSARKFWEKWDRYHLTRLTADQEKELEKDIEPLKESYNWAPSTYFSRMQELQKQTPKTNK